MRINPEVYASLSPEDKAYVDRELAAYEALVERNPLQAFEPHSDAQRRFLEARTPIVAAFAGNRFGKTTSLIIKSLAQLVPAEFLPSHLRHLQVFEGPCHGWLVVPTTDKLYDTMIPALQKWVPKDALVGGRWDKSWSKERRQLNFACGSTLACKTYEQDPSTLGGADLEFVGYDEPPPLATRGECQMRLAGSDETFEMFAMTPLKTNTGWVRREIFRKREDPGITVIRGTIHDNPTLSRKRVAEILGSQSDLWRRAREFGDFVDVGGLIYPDFDRCVVDPFAPDFVRSLDVVVGIDPGIRNCGVAFEGFDGDNTCHIFDELKLQDCTPKQYADAIKSVLAQWGVPLGRVSFVVDPAARQRGQTNAETVSSALALEGIYCNFGQNDVEAGIGQGRTRMVHGRLLVSRSCRLIRDEADDYAAQEPAEGKDDSHLVPIKSNDHVLDAARYGWMERFWDPVVEAEAPQRSLGWVPGRAPSIGDIQPQAEVLPMGFMS